MIVPALREALGLLRTFPVIWLNGIVWGAVIGTTIILTLSAESFIMERISILMLIIMPLFIAGTYGVIKTQDGSLASFFRSGLKYYFNIILPSVIIFFAWVLTLFLIAITLALLGISQDSAVMVMVMFGVSLPIVFFTFFYDTAAVFEDQKVFDSIKRSIEIVLSHPGKVIMFYLALLGLFFIVYLLVNIGLIVFLSGEIEPLISLNQSEIAAMTMDDWQELLGERGVWIIALILGIAETVFVSLLYSFKATFYRMITEEKTSYLPSGEYDEKGRWFRF
jgi:hypothetical protein